MAAPYHRQASNMSFTERLHTALSKPLYQRCIEIQAIIDETSLKELHSVLPLLLESIFGCNNQLGWGIGRVYWSYYQERQKEFNALRQFLSPQGPVLRLVYRLLQDPYCRYEFPISCIPYPSRRTIDEGVLPAFYGNKVQVHHTGRPFGMLTLNAFEFYFFHFAYFLVSPALGKMSLWPNPSEALYPVLLDDYLSFFLPADGKIVPSLHGTARNPVVHHSPNYSNPSPGGSSGGTPTTSRLLISSLFKNLSPSRRSSPQANVSSVDVMEAPETWRSQTFLQILVEFWLGQNTGHADKGSFSKQAAASHYRLDPYQYILSESFLPSPDHVRLVRMFVKHLHYFANSARPEISTGPYSSSVPSPWDEFKRAVWPQFAQKKMYAFLKHGFERWPLDSSFKLMLETWLSFIQPFRYTDVTQTQGVDQDARRDRTVDTKWASFVIENLLFYTVLMQDVLPRFFRVDLAMPQNAFMLFRIGKVFNLPRLSDMVREAESSLLEPLGRGMIVGHDLGQSYLSRSHSPGSGRGAAIGLQFSELEGPGFQYKPLFSPATTDVIRQLQVLIQQATQTVNSPQHRHSDDNGGGFFSWLFGGGTVDYNTQTFSRNGHDDGAGDPRRTDGHLRQALDHFSNVFSPGYLPLPAGLLQVTGELLSHSRTYPIKMAPPENIGEKTVRWGDSNGKRVPETLSPDHIDSDEGPKLTPLGRYQLMNGLRRFDVDYSGDPDVQPIRSYESAFLVRALHHLGCFLNTRFSQEIQNLYVRDDFMGAVAYQFLSPPRPTPPQHKGLVTSPVSEAKRQSLSQPKLRLRWLASYQNLGYILAAFLCGYMWFGMGLVGFVILGILFGLLYGVMRAVVNPRPKTKYN